METLKPYYQDELVTLYNADCFEHADLWAGANVLVTDPPYGIGWSIGESHQASSKAHAGIQNDHDTSTRDKALETFGNKPAIVFGSFRAPFPENVRQTLVWQKPSDSGVFGTKYGYRTDTELIFLLGEHERRKASRSSVRTSPGGMIRYRSGHPHAKPVQILETLIEWTNGTIADPFAGSGTTLLAAKNLRRHAIGFEVEERYCEIAARRLAHDVLDLGALA
ncbi:DNA-methyltransferase [Glutamicibacter arilaitensis]|uniref:DNA-methyltransferase n=1 Tax=Glutamicibacter arilaitensis TaxID=256701 RepID=UPI003FD32647